MDTQPESSGSSVSETDWSDASQPAACCDGTVFSAANRFLPLFKTAGQPQLGHSLDAAIDFFIEIVSGNDNNLRIQVSDQLKNGVLKGLRFSTIHNSCRYPSYKNGSYRITEMTRNDCVQLKGMYDMLKTYINSINIRI